MGSIASCIMDSNDNHKSIIGQEVPDQNSSYSDNERENVASGTVEGIVLNTTSSALPLKKRKYNSYDTEIEAKHESVLTNDLGNTGNGCIKASSDGGHQVKKLDTSLSEQDATITSNTNGADLKLVQTISQENELRIANENPFDIDDDDDNDDDDDDDVDEADDDDCNSYHDFLYEYPSDNDLHSSDVSDVRKEPEYDDITNQLLDHLREALGFPPLRKSHWANSNLKAFNRCSILSTSSLASM